MVVFFFSFFGTLCQENTELVQHEVYSGKVSKSKGTLGTTEHFLDLSMCGIAFGFFL